MRKSLASLALCVSLAACGGDDEYIPPLIDAAIDAVEVDAPAPDAATVDAVEVDAVPVDAIDVDAATAIDATPDA